MVQLDAGARECFMLSVEEKAAVSGNFELIKPNGASGPLEVTVTSEYETKPLYESRGSPDGVFAFDAPRAGVVDFCLANGDKESSDGMSRSLGFAIRVTSAARPEGGDGSLSDLLEFSEQLTEGLLTLTDHQAYMRQREAAHAKVIQNTKARVYWWTICECVVLFALAIWQILYIKSFFETKRSL